MKEEENDWVGEIVHVCMRERERKLQRNLKHFLTRSESRKSAVLLKPCQYSATQLIHTASGHHTVVRLKQLLQNEGKLYRNILLRKDTRVTIVLHMQWPKMQFFFISSYCMYLGYDPKLVVL